MFKFTIRDWLTWTACIGILCLLFKQMGAATSPFWLNFAKAALYLATDRVQLGRLLGDTTNGGAVLGITFAYIFFCVILGTLIYGIIKIVKKALDRRETSSIL